MTSKSGINVQSITSKVLGLVLILFGILCMCAVPLYQFLYEDWEGWVTDIAAMLSGLLVGGAIVYSGAAMFRLMHPSRAGN